MLRPPSPSPPSETDRHIFECLILPDHYLRRATQAIDFEQFRPLLAPCYSPDMGRPADDPVLLLKLEFLQFHDNLSDRQVIERARTDVAYRFFLELRLQDDLPDSSLLSYFRGRLGMDGHEKIFQQVVAQARTAGLIRDRLRLKDATHVIADVAIPTTLVLLAQTRDRLLAAAGVFDPLRVQGERVRAEMLRSPQAHCSDEERLGARVAHLREILAWVDELAQPADGDGRAWQTMQDARRLAHKILSDQDPKAGDRTRSVVDADARRSKHGEWFDGYLLDVMMDADSELITAVNVLPGNGAEGADALDLVRQEETAQGNDIERLSIDGAGFQGKLLRELEDPQGLAIDAYVPPKTEPATGLFGPADFVANTPGEAVTCPAGQTSHYRQRDEQDHSTIYRFRRETCATCALLDRCMSKPPSGPFGRTVRKNDYEAEYQRARQKATTEDYAAVRAEHPKIERKLSELVRRHGARRARYRGLAKVLCQELMAAVVTNVKRMAQLCARNAAPALS
jgi:transposase